MLRKVLCALAAVSAIVMSNPAPAHAACPPAGCILEVQHSSVYLHLSVRMTTWMNIDYANHRVRAYTRFDAYNGESIEFLGSSWNPAMISLWRGTTRVVNSSGDRIAIWTPSVTVGSGLYTCPTSAGAYYASWTGTVATTVGDFEVYDHRSGTAQTYCGW